MWAAWEATVEEKEEGEMREVLIYCALLGRC
jgi:hypothetical protein